MLILALSQIALVLLSWLLTAAMPFASFQSLLSASGIRWFLGNFTLNLANPLLVYIILITIASGSVLSSGLYAAIRDIVVLRDTGVLSSQQWFALRATLGLLLVEIIVVLLLTVLPHAVLLSITGSLFPSSFSAGIIPIFAFILTTVALFYSVLSGKFHTMFEIGQCMCAGGRWLMPVLLLYIFAVMFYNSFLYFIGEL